MIRQNQDISARRFDPNSFDCELPPDARSELVRPKRPVILKRPPVYQPPGRSNILKLGCSIFVVALLLVAAFTNRQPQNSRSTPTAQPTPASVVQPSPAQREQPLSPPPPVVSAPRARLVLHKRWMGNGVWEVMDSTGRTVKILVDPAPRAQLVREPSYTPIRPWHVGETHEITMPYGMSVDATLRGFLANENQLPPTGHIGDMYVVGNVPWIWVTVPGTTAPTWIDP